jgi:membrane-bound lytic murein transglycosylase A
VEPPPPAPPLLPAAWSDLPGWLADDLAAAWPALRQSCKVLPKRKQGELWAPFCAAAESLGKQARTSDVRALLETWLQPHAVSNADGSRDGLITGYYEPLLRGSRQRTARFRQPIHAVPDDLLTIDLTDLFPDLKNYRLRGRLVGNRVVPYWSRGELNERDELLRPKTMVWVEDAVELFFLHVQGSGRIKLPDGSMVRVGYADQNGHPYHSIGRLLVERGELTLDQASMQGIQAWARANPDKLQGLLNANPSYVFFRELTTPPEDGPLGALGVPLTPARSIAVDPRTIPLGAPVFIATSEPNSAVPLQRLVLAQDTGGAIKGVVRADYFWGFGAEAGALAGRMKQRGQLWVLLPKNYPLPWP